MNRFLFIAVFLLLTISCRDAIGPVEGNTPGGPLVVWFNGLSGNADAYFPESDSLIQIAWETGEVPNHILYTGGNEFAVLSSASAELRFFSKEETGTTERTIFLPQGSNPYSFALSSTTAYVALLLEERIAVVNTETAEITAFLGSRSNPSGIEYCGGKIFVSYSSYPDTQSPGGVSVIDPTTGTEINWIDTGVNTHWLKLQPSGMLHCYSTTYADDGKITIIDPASLSVTAVIECGGAPGEAIRAGNRYISPDGWGSGGIIRYSESGEFSEVDLPVTPTNLALWGGTLYASSFNANKVYLIDESSFTVIDSLEAGGEGPQGIIAIAP